jgi:hypothetical protein
MEHGDDPGMDTLLGFVFLDPGSSTAVATSGGTTGRAGQCEGLRNLGGFRKLVVNNV